MNILFISAWFPFPHDTGSRIRIYHLLRALGKRHAVHLVAFLPTADARQYLPAAEKLCARVLVVERDPFWRDPNNRISAHVSLTPRDVIRGYSPEMAGLVEQAGQSQDFDLVIASTLEVAPYALQIKPAVKILEEHNFTTLWMEERYRAQPNLFRRAGGWATWWKCRRYERRLYPGFAAVTMVSREDQQAVLETIPGYPGRVEVIPNGVDLETRRIGLAEPTPDTLVFNGSLTYAANFEAMQFFIREAWPIIRSERPAARLIITGRTGGVDTSWLPVDAGVELTGYLDDVRLMVAGSWLAVAPLRSGGGTRLKVLEAMALGTPVVATSKGAEGLAATHGREILIADEARILARQCLRLLQDPGLRANLTANARRLVEQSYGWQAIGDQFCRLVETL